MKLLTKILLTTTAFAGLSSTLAFADDQRIMLFNGHGSYNLIATCPSDTQMVGLSVADRSTTCSESCAGSPGNYMVTLRDNGHGQQVVR